MKIHAYRTTMPFLTDNRDKPSLSPSTVKGNPLNQVDRDYYRRLNFGLQETDHRLIESPDSGDPSYVITPIFEGEVSWTRNGLNGVLKKDYVVYMQNGPPMIFKNKSYDKIINELKLKGLKWRMISPFVNASKVKVAATEDQFVSLVSDVLTSCFKIESESYKNNIKEVGSGFYIRDNIILTCAHVITKSKEKVEDLGVFVIDGNKKYPAKVVDIDFGLDCAIIYCDSSQHVPLIPKSSEEVDVGTELMCIGSPYGYDNNVTKGILSSKNRMVKEEKVPYFFMDLAVYPGSSGGPVIDVTDGKVFGIAAVIVESVGNYGLNAGIPIEICLRRFSKYLKETKGENL